MMMRRFSNFLGQQVYSYLKLFTKQDWHDFLKIALDFVIRMGNHIQPFVEKEREYTRDFNISSPIFPANFTSTVANTIISKWPKVDPGSMTQNRLVLLLCAALNIDSFNNNADQVLVENLLEQAWNDLIGNNILTRVATNRRGYNDDVFYKDGRAAQNTNERITLPLGHLYSQIIVSHLLQNGDEQLIGDILRNKRVTIEYNDNYVTSMLACEILYRLVKELKSIYNFTLENLSLQIYGKPLNNYQWSDYSYIGHSYPSDQERDKYLDFCFESIDIKATISPNNTSHSRWLKITTEDGHQVEIRPDHSIAGGWWTRRYRYDDFQSLDDDTVIERSNNEPEILYYLVIR